MYHEKKMNFLKTNIQLCEVQSNTVSQFLTVYGTRHSEKILHVIYSIYDNKQQIFLNMHILVYYLSSNRTILQNF